MASPSFRDSINGLGWSRRDPDTPVNTSQQTGLLSSIKSLNPFGNTGYVVLPTTESSGAPLPAGNRREEEEGWFACELIDIFNIIILTQIPGSITVSVPLQRMCRSWGRGCLGFGPHEQGVDTLPTEWFPSSFV